MGYNIDFIRKDCLIIIFSFLLKICGCYYINYFYQNKIKWMMFFLICKLSNETKFSQIIYCIDAYLWINGQYLLLRSLPQVFSTLLFYCSNRILCITMVIISLSKIRGCFVFEFLSPQCMFRHCSFCSKCMFCFGLPDTITKQP